jgi:hypothetical protein
MANRMFLRDILHLDRTLTEICGSFEVSAGAIVDGSIKGRGFVPSRSGTGSFLITLDDRFADLIAATATCQEAAAAATTTVAEIQAVTVGLTATNTVVILTGQIAAGVLADPAGRVNFSLKLVNSINY